MKTQIIQLDPYDDIYSAKDKMGWGQTARILLIWPARGRVLNRPLDLMLLKRHSAELGSQLALVVRDPDIRLYAQNLGIPLYSSIRQAEKSHWRPDRRARGELPLTVRRQSPDIWRRRRIPLNFARLRDLAHPATSRWLRHPVIRLLAFTLGVLSVLAIAALLTPSATISLTPQTQTEKLTISVAANPEAERVDLSGVVPARWQSIIVEGRGSLPTSGTIPIPDKLASGEVLFINLTEQTIPLSAGLTVSTLDDPPIRFETSAAASVPPGEEGVRVPITATTPGTDNNVPAGSILAIEGQLGLNLTVTNPQATRGGTHRNAPAPTEDDYTELHETLYKTLVASALEEVGAQLGEKDIIISVEPVLKNTFETKYTPAEPAPTDQLQLVLELEFEVLYVAEADLFELARAALETNLPAQFAPDPATLRIRNLSAPVSENNQSAHWDLRAEWQVQAQLDPDQAVKLTIGLPPEAAQANLNRELTLASNSSIQINPSWWPRMPVLPFRIAVINDR